MKNNSIKKLSAFVIGCGSIGERHIFNLKKLGLQNISIFDQDKKLTKSLSKKYNVISYTDMNTGLSSNPDFSIISTPPSNHVLIANECMKNNSHVFFEKPISHNLKSVKSLLKKADLKKLLIGVGYNFRFNPGLIQIKKSLNHSTTPLLINSVVGNHIKNWRPNTNYKNHYVLKSGGGIILDASHEYDFVRWILNDKVISIYCESIKIPKLSTKTEGIATIILKFKKGTIANFILDFVRPSYERTTKIFGNDMSITWQFSSLSKSWKAYSSMSKTSLTYEKNYKIKKQIYHQPTNDMYFNELKSFLNSIHTNSKPLVNGWDAYETLKIGMAAIKSSLNHKVIKL